MRIWKRPSKLAFYADLFSKMNVITEDQKKTILTKNKKFSI
ncbi:hypothetical protein [Bacillus sp. UMB0893]|nr:hypothetical protein [Bacillus sp. UMB0893]